MIVRGRSLEMVMIPLTLLLSSADLEAQERTLLMVAAHADDESPVGPVLARYAREGVRVHMLVVTDGAQGGSNTSIPRGPELARVRADEARCAAEALGAEPPILLEFPDAKLGDYTADPSLLFRVTDRIVGELGRLMPDAIVTWGPDGIGHPDHRLVSSIITQLVRAGAPGASDRLYYMSIPAEGVQALYPGRGAPPFMIPEARHFTTRIRFNPEDLVAANRALACHGTQFTDEALARLTSQMGPALNGELGLISAFDPAPRSDLFTP